MKGIDIEVSEVGLRDGLQSISQIMPTEAKKRWIRALALAGVPEIEVGSFVSARIFPQLADTMDVAKYARTIEGLKVAVLVPNLKGAEQAIMAGVHKLTIPDRKSTRLNSSHKPISYAVFCFKKTTPPPPPPSPPPPPPSPN